MRKLSWVVVMALLVAACGAETAGRTTMPGSTTPDEVAPVTITTSSTSTTTTTVSSVTTTTAEATDVTDLEARFFCRDLAGLGYGYADAVTYWMMEGRPDRMDANRNGIPCETVWPPSVVEDFWGDLMPGSSEPPPPPEDVDEIESGLFCRDLAGRGASYQEAVAYWIFEGRPDRMDADENGVPCETVYTSAEVQAVYGSDDALDFYLVATFGDTARFEAGGAAVDAGLVCPSGTVSWPDVLEEYSWADQYNCDDGSGSFIAGVHIYFIGDHEYSAWEIVSGTGAYANLTGGGGCDTGVFPGLEEGLWQDRLYGRVELSP